MIVTFVKMGMEVLLCTPVHQGKYLAHADAQSESRLGMGSADSAVFELYIEQILAPSLQAGQIVILDNSHIHTGEKVRQAIEAQGCQLLFLPSYSPDLSPIEEAFSKLKAFLRRVGARTLEVLQEAIGQALFTITAQDALGWFTHVGII